MNVCLDLMQLLNLSVPSTMIQWDWAYKSVRNVLSKYDTTSLRKGADGRFHLRRTAEDLKGGMDGAFVDDDSAHNHAEEEEEEASVVDDFVHKLSCAYLVIANEFRLPFMVVLTPGIVIWKCVFRCVDLDLS